MSAPTGEPAAELENLASAWRADRGARQLRRHLDPADFAAIGEAGFLASVVPREYGGSWESQSASARSVAEALRTLARGDASVALVAAMHPAVISFWLLGDHGDAGWQRQCEAVFETAQAGDQWGTITSEPGSGGDLAKTVAAAAPSPDLTLDLPGERYRITGNKHFGSGSGISSFMITTGVCEGDDGPSMFVLDVRDRPWTGDSGNMTILAEWDGVGMAATQSHAMRLEGMPAVRAAWPGAFDELAVAASPFIACVLTAVVLGVLDEAVASARERIAARADSLRPFEQTEWTRAEMDHWVAIQAYEGALRALESGNPAHALHAGLRAKQSVAELAEAVLLRLTRTLGGGSFSRSSPFAHWFEDVRALGFLRPPWGLAFDKPLPHLAPRGVSGPVRRRGASRVHLTA